MSVFTNPASGAAEHAAAYVAAVLDLVGDRDPLSVLRETLDQHVREEADSQDALVDHAIGTGCDRDPVRARLAGVLDARDLVHERDLQAFELARHVLADRAQGPAARAAALILGKLEGAAKHRQVRRELLAAFGPL